MSQLRSERDAATQQLSLAEVALAAARKDADDATAALSERDAFWIKQLEEERKALQEQKAAQPAASVKEAIDQLKDQLLQEQSARTAAQQQVQQLQQQLDTTLAQLQQLQVQLNKVTAEHGQELQMHLTARQAAEQQVAELSSRLQHAEERQQQQQKQKQQQEVTHMLQGPTSNGTPDILVVQQQLETAQQELRSTRLKLEQQQVVTAICNTVHAWCSLCRVFD